MATVGPVRSRRSYCWEAAAPNSTPDSAPEWNTKQKNKRRIRQCTTTEHQNSEVHQNNEVHQSRTPDRKQFIAEQYSKCYNRCSTDSETVDQISIHVQLQQSRERRICSRMVKKVTRTN